LFSVKYTYIQYSTVQYSTVQYSKVQYSKVQYRTAQYINALSFYISGADDFNKSASSSSLYFFFGAISSKISLTMIGLTFLVIW